MFNVKNIETLSFCKAVKYQANKSYDSDYMNIPRPCHNFVFIIEGNISIITKRSSFNLKKGDVLYIPQNSTYISKWKAEPNIVFYSIHFRFNEAQEFFHDYAVPVQKLLISDFNDLFERVKNIQRYQNSTGFDKYFYLSEFYYLCGVLMPKIKIEEGISTKSALYPALLYLENNYMANCTISQLASLCFFSPSRFFYLFKKEVGCTPITYKNKILIQKVSQEIVFQRNKSIDTIAAEYGFKSIVYFRRLFKKMTGKTPTQFRKEEKFI